MARKRGAKKTDLGSPSTVRFSDEMEAFLAVEGAKHPLGKAGVIREAVKLLMERRLEESKVGERMVQGMTDA